MRLTAEDIGHLPIVWTGLAGNAFATLDISSGSFLSTIVSAHVGADRGPCNCAAGRGDILTASAPNLMAENAANDGSDNCPRYIGATTLLNDLLAFDPASLFRGTEHGMD